MRVTAEPTPLTADDRLALYEMAARYSRAQDLLDVEAYLSNLTPAARVTDTHGEQFVGHAALRARFERRRELYPEPRQHFIGQPWIEGNSARCVMRMYWIVILRRPDDTRCTQAVRRIRRHLRENRWTLDGGGSPNRGLADIDTVSISARP